MTPHTFEAVNDVVRYAAVDLGAESGRVAVGSFDGERLSVDIVHRFANVPTRLPDGQHWDVLGLFREAVTGLRRAGATAGVGVDAWGCDYALLDRNGRMLGLPFHYRDERTVGMPELAFARVARRQLYELTGIQHLQINTLYQLLAEPAFGEIASRIAMIPDLFNYWLTGVVENEATVASTTGLADPRAHAWALDLIEELGLPVTPFAHDLVEPGWELGHVRHDLDLDHLGVVRTVASHDTAAAFAATPTQDARTAIISSGTWSLVGRIVDRTYLGDGFSNEWGVDGTTRVLRNVMGLWLIQECRRAWLAEGMSLGYGELEAVAAAVDVQVPLFDPDDPSFLLPGDMPMRIVAACQAAGQRPPETTGQLIRSILLSLACKYRIVIDDLRSLSGDVESIHIVGGGASNALLCQLTADVVGLPVIAGPVEATAIGNVIVQARAAGDFGSYSEALDCVRRSFPTQVYAPGRDHGTFERFLALERSESAMHATIQLEEA